MSAAAAASGFALCLLAGAALPVASAHADERYPGIWLNPGFFSYHFDRTQDLREDNIGIGAQAVLARDHALMAGSFINSERQRSRYAGYQWRALHYAFAKAQFSAGVAVAAIDGYPHMRDGGWFVAPLPVAMIEAGRVGMNVAVVPEIHERVHGAIAFQVKVRLW